MIGITLDTGALIALSRGKPRMRAAWTLAQNAQLPITVPTVVVAEWFRESSKTNDAILRACTVEPLTLQLARSAGLALAAVKGATPIDAVVVASAAQRGDVIYTSDVSDLEALRAYFRGLPAVLGV